MVQPLPVFLQRRTLLRMAGTAASGSSLLSALGTQESNTGRSIVLEQDGRCIPITPLAGDEPVENLYEYRYPTDRFDGSPGSDGSTFSSGGTTDLQRDDTSLLFLYDGPRGLSLVVVHGHLEGDGAGGTVTFDVHGLPAEGNWLVRDDYYLLDGEQPASNFDNWDIDGEVHTIDWAYRGGRTDGGVFRGLDLSSGVTIEPAFNEAASLSSDHDFGPIEAWEVLTGDRDGPDRHSLQLTRPVTIRRGECRPDEGGGTGRGADEIDARIRDLSVDGGTFTTDDVVSAEVTVQNTGNQEHTFFVGYSAVDPTGEGHHNDGTTDEPVTLAPGETRTITVEWTVESGLPGGTYGVKVAVWQERTGDTLDGRLDKRERRSVFEVRETTGAVDARIRDLDVLGGRYSTGEAVRAFVTVRNTGSRDHTFFVGYSVIDPNGTSHSNDGTTGKPVTLAADETATVVVMWTVEGDVPAGVYDAKSIVWRESDRDDLRTQLDDGRVRSAFEVD